VIKRTGFVVLAVISAVYLFGCGKKQQVSEETRLEPMSMEVLNTMSTEPKPALEVKTSEATVSTATQTVMPSETKLEPLPPSGPYKPTSNEIQTALKNAGFYTGTVDGKTGPKTKQSIEDFQKANNLKADGVVGAKTWALLSSHLSATAVAETIDTAVSKKIALPVKKR
jgi:peptidoglycan hydrolase-like protein with peptidoglycan-binding domain